MPDLVARAAHLADVGRYPEAVEVCGQALAEDPQDPRALAVLTQTLVWMDRFPEAYDAGSRLLAADPDRDVGHRLLSVVYQHIGTPQQAYEAAMGAARAGPLEPHNHVQVAITARELPALRPQAYAAAQHAVRLAPHLADAHFAVGYTAPDRATQEAAYSAALAIDPDHAGAANNLTVLRGRRRFAPLRELVSGYLGVLGSDPGYEVARFNLVGLCYVFARRYYWAGVALALLAAAEAGVTDTFHRWSVVRAVTGVVALVLLVVYAARMLQLLGPGPRAFLVRTYRSEPSLLLVSLQSAGVVTAALCCLFLPLVPVGLVAVLFLSYLNLPLSLWSRAAHNRRHRAL